MKKSKFSQSNLSIYSKNKDFIEYNEEYNNQDYTNILRDLNHEDLSYYGQETPLHLAAISGDIKKIKTLLDKNISVNLKNDKNFTPLHWSCLTGKTEVIKYLLSKGANLNSLSINMDSILHLAIRSNSIECIRFILEATGSELVNIKNHTGFSPMHLVSSTGNIDAFDLLLNNKCRPFPLNNYDATPLHWACFLENQEKNTPMYNGKVKIAEKLISLLEKENSLSNILNQPNKIGKTALHWACLYGFCETVERLLLLKANIHVKIAPFPSVAEDLSKNIFSEEINSILKKHVKND